MKKHEKGAADKSAQSAKEKISAVSKDGVTGRSAGSFNLNQDGGQSKRPISLRQQRPRRGLL
ncbi:MULTISPECIES: hypothetical protein [Pedobacter]|uniref:hypothetical protein n=1 Tax=Pedobacter TaxID=84567 RepID=UPI00210B80C7|nr:MULTISPECIES: hypothetical protein [unclassified Pedobacter]